MKNYIIAAACALLFSSLLVCSCNKADNNEGKEQEQQQEQTVSRGKIRIIPTLTKVTDNRFENGDAIGVNIVLPSGAYVTNVKMVYDGSAFPSDLEWYDGTDASVFTGWYPYSSAVPSTFSVQTDQSAGLSASDFVAGTLTGVTPTTDAIIMPFSHRMSRLEIKLANNTGKVLSDLRVGGIVPQATLSDQFVALAAENASKVEITPWAYSSEKYYLLLPPQITSLTVKFKLSGNAREYSIPSADFGPGIQNTIEITENSVKLTGVIVGWDGYDLGTAE